MDKKITYRKSGVNIEEGYRAVSAIKSQVARTFDKSVISDIGSFAGLYSLAHFQMKEPVLVSGTDGVGTKLKIAFMADKHDTIGQDLVAMCVNDILCQAAKPLFFLDYIATGALDAALAEQVVSGIVDGCVLAGCALIGGETAEMPGFYRDGEYDLAGFAVGIVDRQALIDGSAVAPGDVLIGIASSGIHANGFSLVRRLIFEEAKLTLDDTLPGGELTVRDTLLTPTKIYVDAVLPVMQNYTVHGAAHITGGGLFENIARAFAAQYDAQIESESWPVPNEFKYLQTVSGLSFTEMCHTFNMGIGFVLVVPQNQVEPIIEALTNAGQKAYQIGRITTGTGKVIL